MLSSTTRIRGFKSNLNEFLFFNYLLGLNKEKLVYILFSIIGRKIEKVDPLP